MTNEIKNFSYKVYKMEYCEVDYKARAFNDKCVIYETLAESDEQAVVNFIKAQGLKGYKVEDITATKINSINAKIGLDTLIKLTTH